MPESDEFPTAPILPFRQAEALLAAARHRTGLMRGPRAMITALHKRGLIHRITLETGTITPLGRRLAATIAGATAKDAQP